MNITRNVLIVAASLSLNAVASAHGETLHLFTNVFGTPSFGIKHEDGTITNQRAFGSNLLWSAA